MFFQILLVSSSRHSDQWVVPGGGVEPQETQQVAAIREVVEEAGVRGNIDRCLGIFEVIKRNIDWNKILNWLIWGEM
jgi:diphosphoinositol-polyphosphate diphosphatase